MAVLPIETIPQDVHDTRSAVVRDRFPKLAAKADAGDRSAIQVIDVACRNILFWHPSPTAQMIGGSLEDYIKTCCRRIPSLRRCA